MPRLWSDSSCTVPGKYRLTSRFVSAGTVNGTASLIAWPPAGIVVA